MEHKRKSCDLDETLRDIETAGNRVSKVGRKTSSEIARKLENVACRIVGAVTEALNQSLSRGGLLMEGEEDSEPGSEGEELEEIRGEEITDEERGEMMEVDEGHKQSKTGASNLSKGDVDIDRLRNSLARMLGNRQPQGSMKSGELAIEDRTHRVKLLVGEVNQETGKVTKGKISFNMADLQTVKRAMSELLGEFMEMGSELGSAYGRLEKEREMNEWLKESLRERENVWRERLSAANNMDAVWGALNNLSQKVGGDRYEVGSEKSGDARRVGTSTGTEVRGDRGGGRQVVSGREGYTTEGSGTEGEGYPRREVRKKRIFAGMVKLEKKRAEREEQRKEAEKKAIVWETPKKRSERYELVALDTGEENRNEAKSKEVKRILVKEKVKELRDVRPLRTGRVVVAARNREQLEQVTKALGGNQQWKVKESGGQRPMARILGVEKGMTDEELIESIKEENEELSELVNGDMKGSVRVIGRKQGMKPYRENVQVHPMIFKTIMKKDRQIYLDLR